MKWTWPGPDLSICLALAVFVSAPFAAGDTPPEGSPAPVLLKAGETVPPFEATGINGEVREVKYKSPTVLVFFLSSCPVCHKMIPEWNQAFERKPAGLEVVGVLMDREPPGFFQATKIAFPVVRSPGRDFLEIWKVRRAPMTVRVGPGGTVEEAAVGIVDPIRLGEIFRP